MSTATSAQKKGIPIVVAAALIVIALTTWRVATPREEVEYVPPDETGRAPTFRLYNQDSQLVNLEAYMHRHVIVLVFFDDQRSPDEDPTLQQLAEYYPALRKEGVVALGVSTRLPQQNRGDDVRVYPFPLLSETTPGNDGSAHRNWGTLIDRGPNQSGTLPAVFVIDRRGQVAWDGETPKPLEDANALIPQLLAGGWQ